MRLRRKKKQDQPYWLVSHEESCSGCQQGYAYAVEVRCFACDGPYCPVCVTFFSEGPVCKVCHQGGGRRWLRARSGKA